VAVVGLEASIQTVALGAVLFFGGAAFASRHPSGEPSLLEGSIGYFDVDRRRYEAAEGMIAYRGRKHLWAFRLFGGALATSRGSLYACSGIAYDVFLGSRVTFTPSFAPGLYAKGGGLDLGYPLEFRSQIEVSCRLPRRSRLGLAFSHMSNAHLASRNPGVETLLVNLSVPVGDGR
jgi:lipid A 3-O-deacylase